MMAAPQGGLSTGLSSHSVFCCWPLLGTCMVCPTSHQDVAASGRSTQNFNFKWESKESVDTFIQDQRTLVPQTRGCELPGLVEMPKGLGISTGPRERPEHQWVWSQTKTKKMGQGFSTVRRGGVKEWRRGRGHWPCTQTTRFGSGLDPHHPIWSSSPTRSGP